MYTDSYGPFIVNLGPLRSGLWVLRLHRGLAGGTSHCGAASALCSQVEASSCYRWERCGSSGRDGWVEDCFASFLFERHVWNIESDILISHSLHEISDISEVHFNEIINPKRTNLVTGEQEIAAGYAKMFAGIYASLKPGGLCACIPWNSSTWSQAAIWCVKKFPELC